MSMTEPSYYALRPLRNPSSLRIEGSMTSSSLGLDQPLADQDSDTYPVDPADKLSRRSSFTRQAPLWRKLRTPLGMVLLPLAAIGYLAFCYTVHRRPVPVYAHGLYAVTVQHLAVIKGAITAISIAIISIALYPVYDMVASLKSEEFFRVLASGSHGVPLEAINYISTPSFGYINMMSAIWSRSCSYYYMVGVVASLLIWITGALAPGALTVDNVLADGELMAFAIGAVPPQGVLNATDVYDNEYTLNADENAGTAASITWAELELGVRYSFSVGNSSESDYTAFISPPPLDLPTTTTARWLSDVIGLNPECSWASTNITAPIHMPDNATSISDDWLATAYLPEFNLDMRVFADDITIGGIGGADVPSVNPSFANIKNYNYDVKNHTTQAIPADGSTVFFLGQCSGSRCGNSTRSVTIDITSVNTTFTIGSRNQTWTVAILVCIPNITIETREIRNDGHGLLSVQPLPAGRQLMRQGNLNTVQTTALFTSATSALSGPQQRYFPLGSQVQAELLFGKGQTNTLLQLATFKLPASESVTISPAPIKNITQVYTQIIQSAAKAYLANNLGFAYVPGRISTPQLIFAASIPNLAVATAVFALLSVLIILVNLRSGKGAEFTLVNVAAAMHGSELPAQFAQIDPDSEDPDTTVEELASGDAIENSRVRRAGGTLPEGQQYIVDAFGGRRIFMQRRADGSPVLHMSA